MEVLERETEERGVRGDLGLESVGEKRVLKKIKKLRCVDW